MKGTQKGLVEEQLSQEIARVLEVAPSASFKDDPDEDNQAPPTIAEKTLTALQTMNAKLQKEIFNYLALKIRLAFAKIGIGIGKDHSSNVLSQETAEAFFREIEDRVARKYDMSETQNVTFSNQKVRDVFSQSLRDHGPKRSTHQRPKSRNAAD